MICIREVKTRKDIKAFIDFPLWLYKDCPYYVPELVSDIRAALKLGYAPAEECESFLYLCYKDEKVAGRIQVIINWPDIKKTGMKRVRFTRLHFIEDFEVAKALMECAERIAAERGISNVHGPMGFNDFDREGLLIGGFDKLSTFETEYNFPYYKDILERLGYYKDVDWHEYKVTIPAAVDEAIASISKKIMERRNFRYVEGYSARGLVKKYGYKIITFLGDCYSPLYGTVPFSDRTVAEVLKQFATVIDPRFVAVIVDGNDDVMACAIALPDLAKAVQKSGGRLFPFGAFRILRECRRKRKETVDLVLIGVLPSLLNSGLNAVVMNKLLEGIISAGVKTAETNLILEENHKMKACLKTMEHVNHKDRRAYQKDLTV